METNELYRKSKSLFGPWQTEATSHSLDGKLVYGTFVYYNEKYFLDTNWGVFYSEDAHNWIEASEYNKSWLDNLYISEREVVKWNEANTCHIQLLPQAIKNNIVLKSEDNILKAAIVKNYKPYEFGDFRNITQCNFNIKYLYWLNNRILLFGEDKDYNKRFAIGEIGK